MENRRGQLPHAAPSRELPEAVFVVAERVIADQSSLLASEDLEDEDFVIAGERAVRLGGQTMLHRIAESSAELNVLVAWSVGSDASQILIRGRVADVADSYVLLESSAATWLVASRAIVRVDPLPLQAVGEASFRTDRSIFRALMDGGAPQATIYMRTGEQFEAAVTTVGADHVDIEVTTSERHSWTVPFLAIACVRVNR